MVPLSHKVIYIYNYKLTVIAPDKSYLVQITATKIGLKMVTKKLQYQSPIVFINNTSDLKLLNNRIHNKLPKMAPNDDNDKNISTTASDVLLTRLPKTN